MLGAGHGGAEQGDRHAERRRLRQGVHPGERVGEAQHADRREEDQQGAERAAAISPDQVPAHSARAPRGSGRSSPCRGSRRPTAARAPGGTCPGRSPRRARRAAPCRRCSMPLRATTRSASVGPMTSRTANSAAAMPSTTSTATIIVAPPRGNRRDGRRPSRSRSTTSCFEPGDLAAHVVDVAPGEDVDEQRRRAVGGVDRHRPRRQGEDVGDGAEHLRRVGAHRAAHDAGRELTLGGDDLVGHGHVGHDQLADHGSGEADERQRPHDQAPLPGRRGATGTRRAARRRRRARRGSWRRDLVPQHHPGDGEADGVGDVAPHPSTAWM